MDGISKERGRWERPRRVQGSRFILDGIRPHAIE